MYYQTPNPRDPRLCQNRCRTIPTEDALAFAAADPPEPKHHGYRETSDCGGWVWP